MAGDDNKNLTNEQRTELVWFLQERSSETNKNGLKRGAIKAAAGEFECSVWTVERIWKRAQANRGKVDSRKKGTVGRKRIDRTANLATMRTVPVKQRQTIRRLSYGINVPKSSTHRMMKRQQIKRVSSHLKPLLSEENQLQRLQFSLDQVNLATCQFTKTTQKVHVDEKWFYLSKEKNTYYLLPDEEEPYSAVQSKNFITKVMFLGAVARPRFDDDGVCVFNGLLGIWPFTQEVAAKRNSKNRPAGTLETKCVEVNKKEYYDAVISKVIPAIQEKWPVQGESITIRQDNAKPHLIDIEKVAEKSREKGWDISVESQPPNSPDFNILDLGFFAAIQSLQQEKAMTNIDELVTAVKEAFWEQEPHTLNSVWLSLQKCMEASMLKEGNNNYKLPHMSKRKLRSSGNLPENITVSQEALEAAIGKLQPQLQP